MIDMTYDFIKNPFLEKCAHFQNVHLFHTVNGRSTVPPEKLKCGLKPPNCCVWHSILKCQSKLQAIFLLRNDNLINKRHQLQYLCHIMQIDIQSQEVKMWRVQFFSFWRSWKFPRTPKIIELLPNFGQKQMSKESAFFHKNVKKGKKNPDKQKKSNFEQNFGKSIDQLFKSKSEP